MKKYLLAFLSLSLSAAAQISVPPGLVQLQKVTVSGTATTSVSLTVPAGYSKIVIDIAGAVSDSATVEPVFVELNGDTTSGNYAGKFLAGGNSAVATGSLTASSAGLGFQCVAGATALASSMNSCSISIPNYTSAFLKQMVMVGSESVSTTLGTLNNVVQSGQWNNTAAITGIILSDTAGGHFVAGTTFILYGQR